MYRRDSRQDTLRKNDRDEIDDKRRKEEDEYYKIRSKVEAKIKEEEVMKKVKQEERLSADEEEKGTEHIESEENVEDYNKETLKVEPPKYERQDILAERKYVNQNANQGVTWNQQPQNNYSYDPQFQSQYQSLANDPSNCKFYMKTGACRFGPRCSRNHLRFENTQTILIPNFFHDSRLGAPMGNEMEYDEVDMIHEFEKFYDDVIGEFRAAGNVTMFKCCQNYVPHLRGNVYVQYSKPEEAIEALNMFNGRFYAGRQLTVELCPVTNWKSSICGLFDKRLCPRGKACNFLHVFRNPGNAYSVPNRTDFDPERAFRSGGYDPSFVNPNHPVFKYYNQRDAYGYRSENAKQNRISSTNDRNKWDKVKNERSHSRSRSRDRDRTSRKRHYSRSRSRSRGRSRSRSHSRSRSRSRSRRRKHSRSSRSSSRSHSYSKKKSKRSRKYSHSSNSSHGSPKKKTTNNDSDVSDTSTDWSDISLDP